MAALLVAGPLGLETITYKGEAIPDLLGGAGFYAAAAAAPFAATQLWARAGGDLTHPMREVFRNRRIDVAGLGEEGSTPRRDAAGRWGPAPLLPAATPTSAEDVGAALVIGLPPDETRRALAAIRALSGERPLFAAPGADAEALAACLDGAGVDVLIVPAASVAGDPLAGAAGLVARGARAVLLTAGPLGGLLLYGSRATTWPAQPVPAVEPTGAGAAFAGALAAWCAGTARADFASLKRAAAVGSAVAAVCVEGPGPKKLLGSDRGDLLARFDRLRRDHKF